MQGATLTAAVLAVLLVSSCAILPASCDDSVNSKAFCQQSCRIRCGASVACYLWCVQHCHDADLSPTDHCELGCLVTSCLDKSGTSQRSCAATCSGGCKASYIQPKN